ncbi:MAG: hypothetical protein MI747_20580, partial [Desulfobacterales bacterium]|nr:hypothetical protein [Desulfobacterales bacterium]
MGLLDTPSLDDWFDMKDLGALNPWAAFRLNLPHDITSPAAWAGILNCCARVGFTAHSLEGPVLVDPPTPSPRTLLLICRKSPEGEPSHLEALSNQKVCLWYDSEDELGRILNCLALGHSGKQGAPTLPCSTEKISRGVDLLNWSTAFEGNGSTPGSHPLDLGWILNSPLSKTTGMALSRAVVATALAATSMTLPLVRHGEDSGKQFVHGIRVEESPNGSNDTLAVAYTPDHKTPFFHVSGTAKAFETHLLPWVETALHSGGSGFAKILEMRQTLALARCPQKRSQDQPPGWPSIKMATTPASEMEDIRTALDSLPKGQGTLKGEIWVSKPEGRRRELARQLEKKARELGYDPDIEVFNASKPGLCRILDRLAAAPEGLDRIEITHAPFQGNRGGPSHGDLESTHRWLQELFPVVEILARRLGLPPSRISLEMNPDQDATYILRGLGNQGQILIEDSFSLPCQPRTYMPAHGLSFTPDGEQVSP